MTQKSVSGQMGSSVSGNVVHPCREVIYSNSRDLRQQDDLELYLDLMTTRTGYLIKHTLPSARYNRWSLYLRDMRRGSPGRIML